MTTKQKIIILVSIAPALAVLFFIPQLIFAQAGTPQGLSISPVTFELTGNPGDVLENKIKVYNPGDMSVMVGMEVEDFEPIGEEGLVIITAEEKTTYSLKQWIKLDLADFTLGPKEQQFVNFRIEIPQNAEPGGHYGSVIAVMKGVEGNMSGSAVAQKVGGLILVSVAGETKEQMAVKEFFTPSFSEYGPIKFEMRFENLGSVHIRPGGFVNISRGSLLSSKVIGQVALPQKNILPGAKRKFDLEWDKKWLIGKYTATIIGSFGASNTPFTAVTTFWVIPWKIIAAGTFGFLIIVFFFLRIRKRLALAAKILLKGEVRHGDDKSEK